jgi:hypothetical protein
MRYGIKLLLFPLLILLLQSNVSIGCSLGIPPLRGFDRNEYIFMGEVVGIVGSFESSKFRERAWGLRIRIDDTVYLPRTPANYFEVIPYELWADCSTAGTSEEKLIREFPIGSKVKVIAKEAKLLPSGLGGGNIRLEILPGSLGNISRNYYEDGRPMTSSQSVFDYQAYRRTMPSDYTESFMPFLDAQVLLPEFELRKDLLRLKNARTEGEKVSILQRLIFYPECCDFDFHRITRNHIRNRRVRGSLIKRREEWNNRGETAKSNE